MFSDDRWKMRVFHIRDAINKIKSYTQDQSYIAFIDNSMAFDAVMRCFQILGEASKKIPDTIKAKYPDVPWRDMAQFRDKIVHDYDGVDLPLIWQIIQEKLPAALDAINRLPVKPEDLE